ncbi:MAG: hypothetical protein EOO24_25045, partial [Comamonadaceae bacterium]
MSSSKERAPAAGGPRSRWPWTATALAAAAFLAGCSVVPVALTPQEQSTQAQADLAAVVAQAEPVTARPGPPRR